jgi:SAM-dependent methyltransferase
VPTTCAACAGALRPWRRVPSHEPALEGTVLLARCPSCGSAATLGDPPAFAAANEAGAYARPPAGAGLAAPLLARFDARRLALLGAPGGRLLDVGAGRGRFVAAARAAGWDATGIEPAARAGSGVVRAGVMDAELAPGELSALSVWHVLEHLDEPGAALERMREWLRPGGRLLAGVPNLGSLQARIGGPRWFHLDPPRHRWHFTARGVQLLLARHGFRVQRTTHVLLEHNPFGMWQSLVSRATPTPSWLYHALKRNAVLHPLEAGPTVAALPLAPLAAGVEALAGLAGRGGTVAVLATRER